MDILQGLNRAQTEAVTTTEGFIRVIAGAGSGKTRALTHRFAYLVNDIGILPSNILCVTFTNKAANEMRQRIHLLTGDNDTGYINTFHGFCVSVLQEDSYAVAYPKSFLVLDNSDIDQMLASIYEERGLTLRDMTFSKARDMIEMQKLYHKPEYYLDMMELSLDTLKKKYDEAVRTDDIIFYGYLYHEKKCFGLDYNDLLTFSLYIFEQHEDIRLKWQQRLEYIMIDEFQDIDDIQNRLMKVLCDYHRNLFIVGDPDQTIYTWRGANVKYLMDFDKAFPDVKTIMMMENYRSVPTILDCANALINTNAYRIKKDLIPTLSGGVKPVLHHAENSEKEAQWIAKTIAQLRADGVKLKDITVMYRAHYVTRAIEDAFLKAKLPYTIYSGVQFFDRREIKDALSYLRMVIYKDDLSFARIINVPKRNIGRRRTAFLREYAEQNHCSLYEALRRNVDHELFRSTKARQFIAFMEDYAERAAGLSVSELLAYLLNDSGYEELLRTEGSQERLDNLAELKQSIYDYEITSGEELTAEQYLSHVALMTNSDLEEKDDKIKLMTVHTAKGLEFPVVFLCGMNEGIFPSRKTKTLQAMEEERRLTYVAITRAEKALYFSESEGRNLDGSPRYPSRFLIEIPPALLTLDNEARDGLIAQAKDYIAAVTHLLNDENGGDYYAEGQRVRHPILGEGTITAVDTDSGAYTIQFDGMPTARKISVRAKLEEI